MYLHTNKQVPFCTQLPLSLVIFGEISAYLPTKMSCYKYVQIADNWLI